MGVDPFPEALDRRQSSSPTSSSSHRHSTLSPPSSLPPSPTYYRGSPPFLTPVSPQPLQPIPVPVTELSDAPTDRPQRVNRVPADSTPHSNSIDGAEVTGRAPVGCCDPVDQNAVLCRQEEAMRNGAAMTPIDAHRNYHRKLANRPTGSDDPSSKVPQKKKGRLSQVCIPREKKKCRDLWNFFRLKRGYLPPPTRNRK